MWAPAHVWTLWKSEYLSFLPAAEPPYPYCSPSSIVTTATELPCLLLQQYKKGDVTIIENPVIIPRTVNRHSYYAKLVLRVHHGHRQTKGDESALICYTHRAVKYGGACVGWTDGQTDRTKERRRLHPSTVPLYNILQACHLCQQSLSNISCKWHHAPCKAVSYMTQRPFCNDRSERNNPHILNLDTSKGA